MVEGDLNYISGPDLISLESAKRISNLKNGSFALSHTHAFKAPSLSFVGSFCCKVLTL